MREKRSGRDRRRGNLRERTHEHGRRLRDLPHFIIRLHDLLYSRCDGVFLRWHGRRLSGSCHLEAVTRCGRFNGLCGLAVFFLELTTDHQLSFITRIRRLAETRSELTSTFAHA